MTAARIVRSYFSSIVLAALALLFMLLLGFAAQAQDAQEAADAGTFPAPGLAAPAGRTADPAAGPSADAATLAAALADHPITRFGSTAVVVAGLVAGARRRIRKLREDTDAAAMKTMLLSFFFGVFLGLVGLAPEVPAVTGALGRALGGATAAMVASFGVSLGARTKRARLEAKGAVVPS